MTNLPVGTKVRITTDAAAPFIQEGDVLTIIDPDAHWDEFLASKGEAGELMADLFGPPPAWPSDKIAVSHDMALEWGPAAFAEGEFEVVELAA